MAGKPGTQWTAADDQTLADGLLRGEETQSLAEDLKKSRFAVRYRLNRGLYGGLPVDYEEFALEEDLELVRWLYNRCTGLRCHQFHARYLVELRQRLSHLIRMIRAQSDEIVCSETFQPLS